MDFFRLILDRLHEELKYPVPIDEGNSRKIRRKSGRLAKKNGNEEPSVCYKSVISETFGGTLRSEVQCHKCNKVKGCSLLSSSRIISYLGICKG